MVDIIAHYKEILKQFNEKIIEHLKNNLDELKENPEADITVITEQLYPKYLKKTPFFSS